MKKLDYKKSLHPVYNPTVTKIVQVEVPPINYLLIDGAGDPNTSAAYKEAVEALFTVSYTLKFTAKRGLEVDYGVMPLEGLWWADDMLSFETQDKSNWKWTMMIAQPPMISRGMVETAISQVKQKKSLVAINSLRFESFTEGTCAQIMHRGPFSEEGPTVTKVHEFIESRGALSGKHHEIYLSDIRRAAPENWKTIVRQPFAPNSV